MTPGYLMTHGADLNPERVGAFMRCELDYDDLGLFAQDAIEVNLARQLGAAVYRLAVHYVDIGYCTITGRLLQ